MMAGQAAIAVKRPNTIALLSVDVLVTVQVANVYVAIHLYVVAPLVLSLNTSRIFLLD